MSLPLDSINNLPSKYNNIIVRLPKIFGQSPSLKRKRPGSGPKPKGDEALSYQVNTAFRESDGQRLEEEAAKGKKKVAALVRDIVLKWLSRRRK